MRYNWQKKSRSNYNLLTTSIWIRIIKLIGNASALAP